MSDPSDIRPLERLRRKWGWRWSGGLHAVAACAILAELLLGIPLSPPIAEPPAARQIEVVAVDEPPRAPQATIVLLAEERPTAAEIVAEEIAQQTAAAVPPFARDLLDPAAPPTPAASAWVQQRILDELAAANRLSTEDKNLLLAQLGERLTQISTPDSIDEVNSKLAAILGTSGRATQPAAEPVAGEFDYDTAQLHDVKRTENAAGGFDYVAVLLDAAGRTADSALTGAEGEQLYKTFQIIKGNPLLERVYRGVVMALMDKLTGRNSKNRKPEEPND